MTNSLVEILKSRVAVSNVVTIANILMEKLKGKYSFIHCFYFSEYITSLFLSAIFPQVLVARSLVAVSETSMKDK